jgi:hypothetical protein
MIVGLSIIITFLLLWLVLERSMIVGLAFQQAMIVGLNLEQSMIVRMIFRRP